MAVNPAAEPGSTLTAPARARPAGASEALSWGAGGQVDKAVMVKVGGRQRVPELVAALGGAGDLGEQPSPAGGQPSRGTVEHAHRTHREAAPDALEGCADGQVGEPVLVEIARRQGPAEPVLLLGSAAQLGEEPPPGGRQPTGGAVQHAHRTSVMDPIDVLSRGAGGQVGEPVTVEVPGRQRLPEAIEELGRATDLAEDLPAGAAQPTTGPVQDIHRPVDIVLARSPHRQVCEPIVVEVGRHVGGVPRGRLGHRRTRHCHASHQQKEGNDQGCPSYHHHLLWR